MPRQAWALLLLAAVFLAPFASARDVEGVFTVEGTLSFPSSANVTGAPLALYVPDTSNLSTLRLHIPQATIFEFRKTYDGLDPGVLSPAFVENPLTYSERSYIVANAEVALLPGVQDGTMGLYTASGATVHAGGDALEVEPRAVSEVGNPSATNGGEPASRFYLQRVTMPHALAFGRGTLDYQGGGGLKLVGPDVEIRASNVTRHETGEKQTGTTERTTTILFVRFDAPATLTVAGVPFQAAFSAPALAWDGLLRFTPREGTLRAEDGIYSPKGGSADLDGRFNARLSPLTPGTQARMDLAGELRATSLAYQPAPGFGSGGGPAWLPWLIFGAVLMGAGGGVAATAALMRRRHRRHVEQWTFPLSVEDCRVAAESYIDAEQYPKAVEWIRLARKMAPTSAALAGLEAFALSMMGHVEESLAAYTEANKLSPADGDHAFNVARILSETGGAQAEIERWLRDAVRKTPMLVIDLEREFPEIAAKPDWEGTIKEARRRLEEGWRP